MAMAQQQRLSDLVPLKDAARRLGMAPKTLRNWVYLLKIESVYVGGRVKFKEETIQQVIERGTVPAQER